MRSTGILVTSARGGVGKSSVAVHLASALAERGRRVLLVDLCTTGRSLDLLTAVTDAALYDIGDLLCSRISPSRALIPVPGCERLWLLPGLFRAERCATVPELLRAIRVAEEAIDADFTVFDSHFDTMALRAAAICREAIVVSDLSAASVRAAAELASALPSELRARVLLNRFPVYPRIKAEIPEIKSLLDEVKLPLLGIVPDSLTLYREEEAGGGARLTKDNLSLAYRGIAARLDGARAPLCIGWKGIKRRRLTKALLG